MTTYTRHEMDTEIRDGLIAGALAGGLSIPQVAAGTGEEESYIRRRCEDRGFRQRIFEGRAVSARSAAYLSTELAELLAAADLPDELACHAADVLARVARTLRCLADEIAAFGPSSR
jgi:hypothetical protein